MKNNILILSSNRRHQNDDKNIFTRNLLVGLTIERNLHLLITFHHVNVIMQQTIDIVTITTINLKKIIMKKYERESQMLRIKLMQIKALLTL